MRIFNHTPGSFLREVSYRFRLKVGLDQKLPGGRALPVYSLACWLTERCNLNCRMCWLKGGNRSELDVKQWLSFFREVCRYRPRFTLTGGEPTLHPGFLELVSWLKKHDQYVSINTNGLHLSRFASELTDLQVDDISISLDGLAQDHDIIRKVSGAWEKSSRSIQDLLAARGDKKRPIVRVVTVLDKDNFSQIPKLAALLADWGVDCYTLQHRWFVTPEILNGHQQVMKKRLNCQSADLNGFLWEDPHPPGDIIDLLQECHSQAKGLKIELSPDIPASRVNDYYHSAQNTMVENCYSRYYRTTILPNGDVTPCLSYLAGNICEQSFTEIWNNKAMRRFRSELKEKGLFPGCFRCCGLFSDQVAMFK